MIHVAHLTRRFGAVTAVDDVSFHVERGEVVGLLGVNGAGKSTTMRMLAGYLPATSGSLSIAGFDVMRQSLEVRRRIGYLPEGVPLFREHRVEEMLLFQGRLHGIPRREARARSARILERVGLAERRRSLISALSKGMRQRVGLAVALLPDPEVLILDEPTSGLDPLQRIEVRALVRELAAERTVLISSHILPEIEAACPRVIILHEGKLVADGTKDGLLKSLHGEACVRVEAVLRGTSEEARRLFGAIQGVHEVRDLGRLGIHHGFEIVGDVDLREDVGALCALRGWPLRELSFRRPSLEELFAKIALGLGPTSEPGTARVQPIAAATATPTPSTHSDGAARVLYNLNPFDAGATRDLSSPKRSDAPVDPATETRP